MPRKFSTTVLDTLLKTVEVEFKVPLLGFGEIKFPVSEHAKEWWKNEKARGELLNAINVAEQKFVLENPENKAAQILHDFSLKNEEDFQRVIAELLNHLDEQKISWLMADKLGKGFEKIVSNKELQDAIKDYVPYLHDELSKIKEFREVIFYLQQKQLITTTQQIKDILLERQTPKPTVQPSFVPEAFTNPDIVPESSDFLPPSSRVPFYRNKVFTGRADDLNFLASSLLADNKTALITQTAAATGIGGIGKTQLAVEFCYRYGRFFHSIHWINARDGNIDVEIAACGVEMGLQNFPEATSGQVNVTLQEWRIQPLRLIVFDNLEDPNILANWLPRLNGLHILITARRQQWSPDLGVEIRQIGNLPRSYSLALLRKLSPRLNEIADTYLDLLAERLGDLPLALDLAGRYLNSHPSLTPEDYLKRLSEQDNILSHTSLSGWVAETNPTKHETSLASTFLISLSQLGESQVDKLAKELFIGAGYLAPNNPIPNHLFHALGLLSQYPNYTRDKKQIQDAEEVTDESLLRLSNIGLFGQNNSVHPLISDFARFQHDKNASTLSNLNKSFQILLHSVETDGMTSVILPIISHIQSFIKYIDLLERSEQIDFYRQYGKYLYHSGNYWESIKVLNVITKEVEEFGNLIHSVNTLNILGLAYREVSEFKKSLAILSRTLDIATENNIEEARWLTINNLGMTYSALAKYDEAILCYTSVLEHKLPDSFNEESVDDLSDDLQRQIVNIMSNLGSAYHAKSQFDLAIKTFKTAINIGKKLHGRDHPTTARDLGNMALSLRYFGKPEQALQYFTEALQIYEKTLDPNHPDLATAISNLGLAYQDLHEDEKAFPYFEKALAINEKHFGRHNHHVAKDIHNLGTVFASRGDYKNAIKLLEEAIEIETEIYGENHDEVAYDYRSLASIYFSLENLDKARRMAEKALAIDKTVSKNNKFPIGEDYLQLGLISLSKRQYKRAIREFSTSLNILENHLPKDHSVIISAKDLLNEAQIQAKKHRD